MDELTRIEVADCLERLAEQSIWNPALWQRCYDLVQANWDNELLKYVYDDVVHYSGAFNSRNIFGFRVKPNRHEIENYRYEFRAIAAAVRSEMTLAKAKAKYGL